MGAGASVSERESELAHQINDGGVHQMIALELVLKSTIENPNQEIKPAIVPLLKAVLSVVHKGNGGARVNACCIIRNLSTQSCNKAAMCDFKLNTIKALVAVLFEDHDNARVHACCTLQNLATVDANRVLMADPSFKLIEALEYTIVEDTSFAREHACATIWNIACNKICRESITDRRMFVVLAGALNCDFANSRMNACGALWNFSCSSKNRLLMQEANDEGHKLVDGLISVLHSDHGVGAAKACGTIWNLSLENKSAAIFSQKEFAVIPLLKRIIKREMPGKLRYYACGALRSLSRLHSAKEIILQSDNHELFTSFGNIFKEYLATICYSQSSNIQYSAPVTHASPDKKVLSPDKKERDSMRKEVSQLSKKEKEKQLENSNHDSMIIEADNTLKEHSRHHHHALPHINEATDVIDQICNTIIHVATIAPHSIASIGSPASNTSHSVEHSPYGGGGGAITPRLENSRSMLDEAPSVDARLIITDPIHNIVQIVSDILHYYGNKAKSSATTVENFVVYELFLSVIVALSGTSNPIIIKRLLDSGIHIAAIDIVKKFVTETNAIGDTINTAQCTTPRPGASTASGAMNGTDDGAITPVSATEEVFDPNIPRIWQYKLQNSTEIMDKRYSFAKLGNYVLNYLINLTKHYQICADTLKQVNTLFPTLMCLTLTESDLHREAVKIIDSRAASPLVMSHHPGHAAHAAVPLDAVLSDVVIKETSVHKYNYAEGIKITMLIALLYGRDNVDMDNNGDASMRIDAKLNGSVSTSAINMSYNQISGFDIAQNPKYEVVNNVLFTAKSLCSHHYGHHRHHHTGSSSIGSGGSLTPRLMPHVSGLQTNRNTVLKVNSVLTDQVTFRFGSPTFCAVFATLTSMCYSNNMKSYLHTQLPSLDEVQSEMLISVTPSSSANLVVGLYQLIHELLTIFTNQLSIIKLLDESYILQNILQLLIQLTYIHPLSTEIHAGHNNSSVSNYTVSVFYQYLQQKYKLSINNLLNLLYTQLSTAEWTDSSNTMQYKEYCLFIHLLLNKTTIREGNDVVLSEVPIKPDKTKIGNFKEDVLLPSHIVACYAQSASVLSSKYQLAAEQLIQQLRCLGYDIYTLNQGSSLHGSFYSAIASHVTSPAHHPITATYTGSHTPNASGVPTIVTPVQTESQSQQFQCLAQHIHSVIQLSSICLIFISPELNDTEIFHYVCGVIQSILQDEDVNTPNKQMSLLFIVQHGATMNASCAVFNPTAELSLNWLYQFIFQMTRKYNVLNAYLEDKKQQSSYSHSDSNVVDMSYGVSANQHFAYVHYADANLAEVSKEIDLILKHHVFTMMTNNIQSDKAISKAKSPEANELEVLVADYKAAWSFINNPIHSINYDDVLADLEDYQIRCEISFQEILTKRIAELLSRGLKTAKRKDFLALCGY